MEHYLDNAATTQVCPEAIEAAVNAKGVCYGNPSSTHTKGREAKKLLDRAREQVSKALGCKPAELVFTSCGSESDNWAIIYGAESMKRKGRHIISSQLEHDAVRKSLDELERRGFEVTRLKGEPDGTVSVERVLDALRDDTILVSLMLVNNETGAVTDISAISRAIKKRGSQALVHSDAVQAFMKIPFSAKTLGADVISISGHKIHAPKGVGALYIKEGVKIKSFIVGGGQENGRRAGTEAMPQIAAFGAACEAAYPHIAENAARMGTMKARIIKELSGNIPEFRYIESEAPHILSISLPGWRSEVLMNYLEAREVYVSKSSACKKGGRSIVLESMGLDPKLIDGAIRIGISRFTSEDDVTALVTALTEAHDTLAHR